MEQRSEEWKTYRRSKIGASDAPCIMGVGYKTPLQLWEEKVLGKETAENAGMRFGTEQEPLILSMIEKKLKKKFKPHVLESTEYSWMIASLDGIARDRTVLEIKCNNEETHEMVAKGKAPVKHYPQIQHQCFVAKVPSVLYASFHKNDLQLLEINADEAYQAELLEKEKEFWDRMRSFSPPEPTDRDLLCKDEDDKFIARLTRIFEWDSEIKKLEALKEKEKLELIPECAGRSVITRLGKITHIIERGRVDYTSIPELQGIDLDLYRKEPIEKWKFTAARA